MRTLRAVRRLNPDPVRTPSCGAYSKRRPGRRQATIASHGVKDRAREERLGVLYQQRWASFAERYRAMLASVPDNAKTERMLRAGDYLSTNFAPSLVIAIFCFNPKEMAITDPKLRRISMVERSWVYTAVENLLLACRTEGLGCVLTTLLCECEPEVRELLAIPEPWGTTAVMPIGYPVGRGHGPITRRPIA